MAKIPTYPALTAPDDNDELVIEDSVTSSTKKITRGDFLSGSPLPTDTVDTQAIQDDAINTDKIDDGAVTPANQSGGLIYVVKLTGGPSSSTTPLGLGSITIPALSFAYYLDIQAHWTGSNSVSGDEFLMRIRTGTSASAGTTLAQTQNRHLANANERLTYSIGGIVADATSVSAYTKFVVAASTEQSVNAGVTRVAGTGTITTHVDGIMVAKVIPQ